MKKTNTSSVGDVVRAIAASDAHLGFACGLQSAAEFVTCSYTKAVMKRIALKNVTKSMIYLDRSITGDQRGVPRVLPEVTP